MTWYQFQQKFFSHDFLVVKTCIRSRQKLRESIATLWLLLPNKYTGDARTLNLRLHKIGISWQLNLGGMQKGMETGLGNLSTGSVNIDTSHVGIFNLRKFQSRALLTYIYKLLVKNWTQMGGNTEYTPSMHIWTRYNCHWESKRYTLIVLLPKAINLTIAIWANSYKCQLRMSPEILWILTRGISNNREVSLNFHQILAEKNWGMNP